VEHAHAFAVAHLLAAMAELGVADHLADGPKTANQLPILSTGRCGRPRWSVSSGSTGPDDSTRPG
jgi:hypothetical protein